VPATTDINAWSPFSGGDAALLPWSAAQPQAAPTADKRWGSSRALRFSECVGAGDDDLLALPGLLGLAHEPESESAPSQRSGRAAAVLLTRGVFGGDEGGPFDTHSMREATEEVARPAGGATRRLF